MTDFKLLFELNKQREKNNKLVEELKLYVDEIADLKRAEISQSGKEFKNRCLNKWLAFIYFY